MYNNFIYNYEKELIINSYIKLNIYIFVLDDLKKYFIKKIFINEYNKYIKLP